MLPPSFQVPASIVLLAGGALACFAGYRLFRQVLAVYGFILGALIATSVVGQAGTWVTVLAALGGGLAGALLLVAGYFVGVALVGAALGAFLVHVGWRLVGGDPHWAAVLACAALGAIAAMAFQRHVIIAATAFGGAWTMLVGAAALMLGRGATVGSSATDVWVVYPGYEGPASGWVYVAWVAVALTGVYVQLHAGGRTRPRKK
ncbi:MAG TPA: DUF4203 domain-containing protein [Vicinamibacterales bacterium]|nr:DUF4203 domain-containing protein [Vicinamibacterales bacterium]HPW19441.1 DUF4203 domain-containing protein [Vicinamibacterales bacterium]